MDPHTGIELFAGASLSWAFGGVVD